MYIVLYLIDFAKAFDQMRHDKLFHKLTNMEIPALGMKIVKHVSGGTLQYQIILVYLTELSKVLYCRRFCSTYMLMIS